MCLILFAVNHHPSFPLILAANRDEFYQRPTRSAQFWPENPQLLAGYDYQAEGTWLGITRQGRLAAVTNIRDGIAEKRPGQRSRGLLTRDFLLSDVSAESYLQDLTQQPELYPGFNLLLVDSQGAYFLNNEENQVRQLKPGIHGLSNGTLDSPWPKLLRGKQALQSVIETQPHSEALLNLLSDRHQPLDSELPDTGVPMEWERLLASSFICSEDYGTRASSALLWRKDGEIEMVEQNYNSRGATERNSFKFQISS
ncbi:MAG: NRDE family protein [Motiliproteus sp.]|nr:NRDE family protein [Motiliproteus sp.]